MKFTAVFLSLLVLFFPIFDSFGQNKTKTNLPNTEFVLKWKSPGIMVLDDTRSIRHLSFDDITFGEKMVPMFLVKAPLKSGNDFTASLTNIQFENLTSEEIEIAKQYELSNEFEITSKVGVQKQQLFKNVSIIPLRKRNGTYHKLVGFDLIYDHFNSNVKYKRSNRSFALSSVLETGEIYRIGVMQTGITSVSFEFLANAIGSSDPIPSNDIHLFGNGFGQLPYQNNVYRPDDLLENAIHMEDGSDGFFGPGDYFLFYGKQADKISELGGQFVHSRHAYCDTSYYFVKIESGLSPKRIQTVSDDGGSATHTVSTFNDFAYLEKDEENLTKSGAEWYGDQFDVLTTRNYSFSFPNVTNDLAYVKCQAIAYHQYDSSRFQLTDLNNSASKTVAIPKVGTSIYAPEANVGTISMQYAPTNSIFSFQLDFIKPDASAKGWLNYFEINATRNLTFTGPQISFQDFGSVGIGNKAQYSIQNATNVIGIWEVTDPSNIKSIAFTPGNSISFIMNADSLRYFAAYNGSNFIEPVNIRAVANQNLHALPQTDYIITVYPQFLSEAERLADFHRARGLNVHVATTNQIYNEFSSGMRDITAIRDFTRMFYERANGDPSKMPKYILLFGDGSYDNKYRLGNNHAFIPTYQSADALAQTSSFTTDDFYGMLDFNEGIANNDYVDVGIGRFVVTNLTEAANAVNKTIHYMTNNSSADGSHCNISEGSGTLGDWRNKVLLMADDEDFGTYVSYTENDIVSYLNANHPEFNLIKGYLDSYSQISTPGGERYPEVAELIKNQVQEGCLVINYMGHGGEAGWAHERILDIPTINNWTNYNSMPLFMTATCEFTRFDDPNRASAGELVFLNPNGGGVALFTTTRLVYSSGNAALNKNFYENVFVETGGMQGALGDIFMNTKNATTPASPTGGYNHRKFSVIGDPALILASPKHHVITDSINGVAITVNDTLGALSTVTVHGRVTDNPTNVDLTNFNGYVFPTVYDKSLTLTTLQNNSNSPALTFSSRKNVIYKGKASVVNGKFSFSFVVPKDIAYNIGPGRISYYAHDGQLDAHGYTESFQIGGADTTALADNIGPELDLFMNNEQFVSGGTTDESPNLFARVFDENGINTVGNGIGHDITAILDENTSNSIILNNYYESDLDTYKSGEIRYAFSNLENGEHTLSLKVWDVHNNSNEKTIDFIVAESSDLALEHVLNYPNPFTTNTTFYFEHNQICQTLDVQIQIYTISGKLVKSFDETVFTEGYRIEGINWDGRDQYGDQLGKGVYVYNVNVQSPDGLNSKKTEKLVILK